MQATITATRSADRRLLFIALALGVVAAGLTIAYLRSAEARSRIVEQVVPMSPVVVAREVIPAGQKIGLNMVEVRPIPSGTVGSDTATSVEQVIGQTARYPISSGEQVSRLRLIGGANGAALSFHIPPGLRAFTVPINANRSPASMLVPGDFVDVLAVLNGPDLGVPLPANAGDPDGVLTVLQNVQVLAVQTNYVAQGAPYDSSVRGAPPKSNVNTITLAVTPEEAQFLTLLLDRTKLFTVALRGFGDDKTREIQPAVGPVRATSDRPTMPQP
jgi:pilus assembly protein CpaB